MKLAKRLWESPALMTGASLATRTVNAAVILALALATFTAEEVIIWQLIVTIVAMQLLLDLGLTPTFVRLIAYEMSGRNWTAIGEIWTTLVWIYRRLAVAAFLLIAGLGTMALVNPVSVLPDPARGWMAWAIVLVVSPLVFAATPYSIYLQGINEVASLRRWEALTGLGAIVSSIVVLLCGGHILALVINAQAWAILNALRDRSIALSAAGRRLGAFPATGKVETVFWRAWPATWRSGLGVLIAAGFVQLTGVVYAQIGEPTAVAAYLIALRFISAINQFSQAPFYSKLPFLARLHAQGDTKSLIAFAQRGMRLSLWTFVCGVSFVSFSIGPGLKLIHSTVSPPPTTLWWLMAAAFFAERFGAMHLQLYSLTNTILWHIINGVSGMLTIIAVFALYPAAGVYAFPLSLLIGYCGFYSWYCARLVYITFHIPFLRFETTTSIPASFGLATAAVLQFMLQ